MKDVFGRKLMRLFKEHNQNHVVAAWTKEEAITILLTDTNSYGSIDNIDLKPLLHCGYAGQVPKVL